MSWEDLVESRLGIPGDALEEFAADYLTYLGFHLADEHLVLLDVFRHRANDISWDIFYLAYYARRTDCEDQRDHIYALLSTQQARPEASGILPD